MKAINVHILKELACLNCLWSLDCDLITLSYLSFFLKKANEKGEEKKKTEKNPPKQKQNTSFYIKSGSPLNKTTRFVRGEYSHILFDIYMFIVDHQDFLIISSLFYSHSKCRKPFTSYQMESLHAVNTDILESFVLVSSHPLSSVIDGMCTKADDVTSFGYITCLPC